MSARILPLDPARYESHRLHRGERLWLETNCYVDLWLEALHAFGFEPTASLAFTVALDFEGDQWLFFKQPSADLWDLHGVDVHELNIWHSLIDQTVEQVSRGRLVMIEVDAFHLPDTAGVSYRLAHTKTTIGVQAIDPRARTLEYFHNAGYFALSGEDFAAVFGLDDFRGSDDLVPYTEFAKLPSGGPRGTTEALVRTSVATLRKHVARIPATNPVARFAESFDKNIAWLQGEPQEAFHQYAFATLRQCGACYELAGSYLRFLTEHGETGLDSAIEGFETLASQSKTLQFKAARAVMLKRPVDFAPMFTAMNSAWERATTVLAEKYT